MGWCHAFGPQIREGCDHAMVAGSRSCSCPECGAVCPGKFPGCTAVWAAGPQKVNLRRPGKEPSVRVVPEVAATNGRAQPELPAPAALPPGNPAGYPRLAEDGAELRSAVEGLRVAIDALPGRIAKVAGDAMRQQHSINKQELADLWLAIHAEVEQLRAMGAHPPGEAAGSQAVVEQLDARFQWLVNELSARFMTVGNELVRIEQLITESNPGPAATNGRTDRTIPAQP
jgi:hypothetical protein